MRRLLLLGLGFGAVLLGSFAAAWIWLFWTPSGRTSLKALIEGEIGAALGGDLAIGEIAGALPDEVILRDLSFHADGEEWLHVDEMSARWRPLALISRRIDAESLSVGPAVIRKSPPKGADNRNDLRGFVLPDNLPQIRIAAISLTEIRVAQSLAGDGARLDGGGAILLGGKTLDVKFKLHGADEKDVASIRAVREGDALTIDALVRSDADGALAAVANLGGGILIEAGGDGPLADYRLEYSGALGAYGEIDGSVSGDFEAMRSLTLTATASLGPKLANTARIVGTQANATAVYSPEENGGQLSEIVFRSAIGDIEGALRWRNRNNVLDHLEIEAAATINEEWRPDIRPYVGDKLSLSGDIRPRDGAYNVSGKATATFFDAVLNEIETDLRDFARGPAEIVLKPNESLPDLLARGGVARGDFYLIFGESIEAGKFRFKTAEDGEFSGAAEFDFNTRAFAVKGDAVLPPVLVSALAPNVKARSKMAGVIDIKGSPETFGGVVAASLPPLLVGRSAFPASRFTLALAEAPTRPSGQISLRAIDNSRRLTANFARLENGEWRVRAIDYSGAGFALNGSAGIGPEVGEVALDLSYRGTDGAEPWPGVPLVGEFTAAGAILKGAGSSGLTIKSTSLASDDWAVSGFLAATDGPPDRLSVKADITRATVKDAAPVKNISTVIAASLGDISNVTIETLSAEVEGAPFKLNQPAAISVSEDIRINGLRASLGRRGSLDFDGSFEKSRWRGRLVAVRAPIVSAASIVDLDIDFDTDRKTPAIGAFSMTSLLTKTEQATLSGEFHWDGSSLIIRDDERTEALDLSLNLPMRLSRSPSIAVIFEGPVDGSVRYDGRLETIAGFLPSALQSVEGALSFNGGASGTLESPKLAGSMTISNGAFTELATGFSIVNIEATATADATLGGSRIAFKAAGGGVRQNEKTIRGEGILVLGKDSQLSSILTFNRARLSAGPVNDVEASGSVDISGPIDDLLAKGKIAVGSLDARVFTPESTVLVDINVVAVNGDGENVPAAALRTAPPAIALALEIEGDDRIFIRGRGLESEWRADVSVLGRADAPVIVGSMTMKNGDIVFAGRRFELTEGDISFDRLSVNNPTLNIRAERQTRTGTLAAIVFEGRANAPKISLSSTPSLPQEDIMALVLFDKPANELSALESLQVAEGLAELGGIGPFGGVGVTGSARQALGLDLLNLDIDQDDSAASSLTVGKYVADGLFVSATQDARGENGSLRIEYEIDQSFTVETELRQDGDQKASINWKRDF